MIWVDEPYRYQGIGSELLADTERELKENGAYGLPFLWQDMIGHPTRHTVVIAQAIRKEMPDAAEKIPNALTNRLPHNIILSGLVNRSENRTRFFPFEKHGLIC